MQFRSYETRMSDAYDIQRFTGLQSPRVYKCRFHLDEPIHLKISLNTYIEQTVYPSNFLTSKRRWTSHNIGKYWFTF